MDKGKCKGLVGPKGPQAAVRRSQAAVPFIVGRSSFIVMKWPFSNIKKGLSMMAYAFA